jgi:hypothetical protein
VAKKAMVWLAVFFVLTAVDTALAAGTESEGGAFAGGVLQPIADITGTRLKVTRSHEPIKPPVNNNIIAFSYYYMFYEGYFGKYRNEVMTRVNENKTVYGKDLWRNICFELPAMLNTDIDMYWFEDYRVIFDKEKNIVVTLADTTGGDLLVAAYQASGLALKDVAYLGAYRADGQPKLIVSDEFRVYVVDVKTMRNEREYDLQGLKAIGANTGLPIVENASRLGVFLVSRDNRAMHYLDLPAGEISLYWDLAQSNVSGEFVKIVSGWSGYITGGYGGAILVKDNQNYALYSGTLKKMMDRYPYDGKQMGDVKDIYWTILYGVRPWAIVAVIERDGPFLISHNILAKDLYE